MKPSKAKILEGGPGESTRRRSSKKHDIALAKNNFSLFINRELSWLQFNYRVLEEAGRKDNPLLERLKFLSISESNLNEFFMVRVAGLHQVIASSINEIQMDGRTPMETLQEISRQCHQMTQLQYRLLADILQGLAHHGLILVQSYNNLEPHERKFVSEFFEKDVFRVLTPLAIDPSHPFPHITSGRLNQAITLKRKNGKEKNQENYAVVEVPTVLSRFLELPRKKKSGHERKFIPLEEILKLHAEELFSGTQVKSIHGFTITRSSELSIDEVASENLLSTIEEELKNRKWGEAVRLNFRQGMPEGVREFLRTQLSLDEYEMYERSGMLNLQDLLELYNRNSDYRDLRDIPFIPKNAVPLEKPDKIFQAIRKKDILLHHPYDSFSTVVDLLSFASRDPKVLAIKQTLYRTSGDSPVVRSLIQAAENDKQVTVLVELKARFDEEKNIVWAREMEKHGVHVVYGLVGLKIHGKMLQIIRRENDEVKSYVHLSTGNYNPSTAKMYTDVGLLTADPEINKDVTNLFHTLTGFSMVPKLSRLAAAPINLRETLEKLITKEIANCESGKPARIRLKLNNLVDPDMILLLYKASRTGVKIDLSIRGICSLKPGIPGLSENIRVESIVGRFLEHSRIFYFENGGSPRVFLSSADWMPRNLNRRVEIMFPVDDPDHVRRLVGILDAIFRDNHNARRLLPDGSFERVQPTRTDTRFSSQRFFREEANKEFEEKEKARKERRKMIFQPMMNPHSIIKESEIVIEEEPDLPETEDLTKTP